MDTTMMNGQTAGMARMPDKALIFVGGAEAGDFLQSLLTANMDLLAKGHVMPGALLTPQGRILFDMMIYRRDDGFVLESDAPRINDLFARLRRYRLRRPIILEILDHLQVWVFWGDATIPPGACADPRHPALGHRHLVEGDQIPHGDIASDRHSNTQGDTKGDTKGDTTISDINQWHAMRIAAGIPEGPIDLVPERALMLEAALDKLGAVDFTKGCYIGQEVTARTHYRGLVKRRLVPVRVVDSMPPTGSDITYQDRVIATSKTTAPAVADGGCWTLGLIKLSDIHAIAADPTGLAVGGYQAALHIPDWMVPLPDPARTDS